ATGSGGGRSGGGGVEVQRKGPVTPDRMLGTASTRQRKRRTGSLRRLPAMRLVDGPSTSDTLACVQSDEPDWQAPRDNVPAALFALLQSCIRKEPHKRVEPFGEPR